MRSGNQSPACALLAAFVLLFCVVMSDATAQGMPMTAGMGSFGVNDVRIIPKVGVGFQKIFLNFNLPTVVPRIFPGVGTLDLVFQDADVWVGAASLTAEFPMGLSLTIMGQANAKRTITVFTPQEVQTAGTATPGVSWTGGQLQWWTLEGIAAYKPGSDWSILCGLRREHLTVTMTDPRDAAGNPLNLSFIFTSGTFTQTESITQVSDLRSKLWIPYLGLGFDGPGCHATLLWSPFVTADVRIPAPLNIAQSFIDVGPSPFNNADLQGIDIRYQVLKPATFLEGTFEYHLTAASNLYFKLWGTASWICLKGDGKLTMSLREVALSDGVPVASSGDDVAGAGTASFTRGIVAAGLSATLSF